MLGFCRILWAVANDVPEGKEDVLPGQYQQSTLHLKALTFERSAAAAVVVNQSSMFVTVMRAPPSKAVLRFGENPRKTPIFEVPLLFLPVPARDHVPRHASPRRARTKGNQSIRKRNAGRKPPEGSLDGNVNSTCRTPSHTPFFSPTTPTPR